VKRFDTDHVVVAIGALLAAVTFAAGYTTRLFQAERVIVQTQHVHDTASAAEAREFGPVAKTVDGAQVNEGLAGTSCALHARDGKFTAVVCK